MIVFDDKDAAQQAIDRNPPQPPADAPVQLAGVELLEVLAHVNAGGYGAARVRCRRGAGVQRRESTSGPDLDALTALMTDDHRFVDSEGATVDAKTECVEAWRGFFAAFPDYRNVFDVVRNVSPVSST